MQIWHRVLTAAWITCGPAVNSFNIDIISSKKKNSRKIKLLVYMVAGLCVCVCVCVCVCLRLARKTKS